MTLKKQIWAFALAVAVLLTAFAAAFIGYPRYRQWQSDRFLRLAKADAEKGAFVEATLKLRHILDLMPERKEAHQALAEIAESSGDPTAVLWRKRVAELYPDDANAIIAYARVASRFKQAAAAQDALSKVPSASRSSLEYKLCAGEVAEASANHKDAIKHFEEAVELAPGNSKIRLSLATAQIATEDYFTREAGRKTLIELAAEPQFALVARRALTRDFMASGEFMLALRESRMINSFPTRSVEDKLTYLTLLQRTQDRNFRKELTAFQEKATTQLEDARALLSWMSENGLAEEGIEWATQEIPEYSTKTLLQPPLAACYLARGDWDGVLQISHDTDWGSLEYVRHVYRSRALREKGELSLALSDWKIASTVAASNPQAIIWLARTADRWGWADEAETALWAIVEKGVDVEWALQVLIGRYYRSQNTRGLRRVASAMVESDPTSDEARNNFVSLSLLVDSDIERFLRMSRELYLRRRDVPAYVSTYAYALFRTGDIIGAVKVFDEEIPKENLQNPTYAAYYGVILEAAGRGGEALPFLQKASSGALLSEEAQMVNEALTRCLAGRGGNGATSSPCSVCIALRLQNETIDLSDTKLIQSHFVGRLPSSLLLQRPQYVRKHAASQSNGSQIL